MSEDEEEYIMVNNPAHSALTIALLMALSVAAVIRCCLPGELFHRPAAKVYAWAQVHRPAWVPEKLTWCVFCASFWFLGLPTAAAAAYWLHWWALSIPLPLALLTEHFTARFFR